MSKQKQRPKNEELMPWESGKTKEPWDIYGEWLIWMGEKMSCLEHCEVAWEELDESVKPHIYGVMYDAITAWNTRPEAPASDAVKAAEAWVLAMRQRCIGEDLCTIGIIIKDESAFVISRLIARIGELEHKLAHASGLNKVLVNNALTEQVEGYREALKEVLDNHSVTTGCLFMKWNDAGGRNNVK